jgi:leucyl aminopeptidase
MNKKLNKIINKTKNLIDLPNNKFNLSNYKEILYKNFPLSHWNDTEKNKPIKLMSGQHPDSGIITSGNGNIIIVGKGVIFDSGGLDLKPHGMNDMINDKAGMLIALAISDYYNGKIKAICPVTDNFIQKSEIIPGDEINIGKKTVKVTNTDAEGRLILAEVLAKLKVTKSDIIITIATLTGGCEYAIGSEATAILSDNKKLLKIYADAAFKAKELAWGLPLWEHYQEQYYNKKKISNHIESIKASTIQGAMFIKQFISYPENWIHLDIAASAFNKDGTANGAPIKSLINFIRRIK